MELVNKSYETLINFINKSSKDKNLEFELRFIEQEIDQKTFEDVFNKLTFSKSNNGFGFKYEMVQHLDVFLKSNNNVKSRMTLLNEESIKKYWIGIEPEEKDILLIEKEKIDTYDDKDYNFRIALSQELPKEKFLNKNKLLLTSNNSNKYYRLKNRYSIKSDDDLFHFDLSIVKSGYGLSFKSSNTLNANSTFEIEIEYNNQSKTKENTELISKKLIKYLYSILSILNNTNNLVKNKLKDEIISNYKQLVNVSSNTQGDQFIAARPRTLHKHNLVKGDEKNLYNRYGVTLKADGVNYFMFVNKDGKIYYFNNNYNIEISGYESKEFVNTLIEGEMIEINGKKKFFAYDMLFFKGTDIRRKLLISLRRKDEKYDESMDGRLDKLSKFMSSTSIKVIKDFDENNLIKYEKKPYEFSLRSDGSDIFEKIKRLWDSRKSNEFHSDGLIFVPIYEHYPLQGKTWDSLFKWKPPQLNTIDFLVKYVKDENGNIINSPYIENVQRLDNKTERKLRLYRTLELYVSGSKYDYNKNAKRMMYSQYPVLFNPYKNNNLSLNNDNSAKVFIDSEQKIFATDPLTNITEEIFDDTIVECSYNMDNKNGFNWFPIRNRPDKTTKYKKGLKVFGNNEKVAIDIFHSIKNPITEEIITSGEVNITNDDYITSKAYWADLESNNISKKKRYPYQNFHNLYIKQQLLHFTSPNYLYQYSTGMHGKILDGCCGKGVDITKIKNAGYAEVVGIEFDQNSVEYAISYYKSKVPRPKPKAFYVRGDLSKLIFPTQACGITESDKIYIKKFIPSKYYFNTMSLNFCIHYFFKDEISFRTIIQNANDALQNDGYLIGTCFDGERIHEQLKNKNEIIGKTYDGSLMWKIEKKYKGKLGFTERSANLGKQIDVYVQTIGNVHPEYLVNFKYFERVMKEYGFEKILIQPFEEFYNELKNGENKMNLPQDELDKMIEYVNGMSEAEKDFSFLSSAFIFKKIENSSDSLYKKLIELMEKKAKTINDTIKLVTKNESEQIIQEEIKETQKAEAKSKEEKINEDLEELTNEIEELTNEAKETMEDLEDLEDSEKINNETKESEEETMEDLEELSGETEAEETMEDLEELTNETEES
jgi:hypothetical protein